MFMEQQWVIVDPDPRRRSARGKSGDEYVVRAVAHGTNLYWRGSAASGRRLQGESLVIMQQSVESECIHLGPVTLRMSSFVPRREHEQTVGP